MHLPLKKKKSNVTQERKSNKQFKLTETNNLKVDSIKKAINQIYEITKGKEIKQR